MKISKRILVQIVKEELAAHTATLLEIGHTLEDAQSDNKEKEGPPKKDVKGSKEEKGKKDDKKPEPSKKAPSSGKKPEELPADEEPADDDLEKDVSKGEDAEDVTGGKIADELTGKTVQSLTMEPKSKILPGCQEIVLTFDQITDPLRILVSKSGQVKFYFRGLHNTI